MHGMQKTTLARYQYDALDRLMSTSPLDDAERQRFYSEDHLVTEVRGTETVSIVQSGGQLLAQQQRSGEKIEIGLLASDLSRSVLAALQMSRHIPIAYSPYGHRPLESGLASVLGFNGEQPDPVTGHYLLGNGYRAFNPYLMRFNSPDSLSPFGKGGLNSYAYCKGDPVNMIDPTGHSFLYRWLALVPEFSGNVGAARTISRYKKISSGLIVFGTLDKKGSRLTVVGHGSPGIISPAKGVEVDALMLNKLLEKNGVFAREFDSVHMVSCFSADSVGQSVSLAESFSRISGRPVKGYHGRAAVTLDAMLSAFDGGKTPESISFMITKGRSAVSRARLKKIGAQYEPQTFYPASEVPSKLADNIRA
ncbi:hypothetical protein D3C76_429270 [compost metagenome]